MTQSGQYFVQVRSTSNSTVTPVLRYVTSSTDAASSDKPIAAAIFKSAFGSELHFFFDSSEYTTAGNLFGDLWATWLTRGVYFGFRRTFLSPHVDDLMIGTRLWDVSKRAQGTVSYRATASNIDQLQTFQSSFPSSYGPGSLKVLFAINGIGLYQDGTTTLVPSDPLRTSVISNSQNFDFLTHSWTHMDFTCPDSSCSGYSSKNYQQFKQTVTSGQAATYQQVWGELNNNNNTIKNQLFNTLSSNQFRNAYSLTSMVSPSYSGFFNPNAIKALTDFGIQIVVGDNSREELWPFPASYNDAIDYPPAKCIDRSQPEYRQTNFYHGRWLTAAVNGYTDAIKYYRQILMVPRTATNIFYHASTIAEEVSVYNNIYSSSKTYSQIYAEETKRALISLLSHRWDPIMFHQANTRVITIDNKSTSLLQYWIESVMTEYRQYSTLPVTSVNLETLGKMYIERMEREVDCAFQNVLNINNGQVTSISFKSQFQSPNGCVAKLTGLPLSSFVSAPAGATSETYGPDTTITFTTPGSKISSLGAGYSPLPAYQSTVTTNLNSGSYLWN
eukprot:TRINITY_DN1200_c0_g2_i4.p1 TRINITY_DN1200_c0_g2~~TRINITY_DN1200_c0_g2_i4.p1  ORF type:complete len:558 (+),score=158.38 TRINITY_DN1200_c0_g2_i4:1099-2772(+)